MIDTIGDVLLVAGSAWMLLATIGVLRFDDVYSRLHAVTKAATLGLLLILTGAAVQMSGPDAGKLAITGVFVFITAPVGAHLISRAITLWGVDDVRIDTVNELPPRASTEPQPDEG